MKDLMPAGEVGAHFAFVPGKSRATLLVLHGTGGDENDLLPLARRLAPNANLLAPRGPVLENGMPRFFRRLALGVFDQVDLERRTAELGRFVAAAVEAHGLDARQIFALGYSNGANIAASLLLRDAWPLQGAALLRPVLPFEPATVPDQHGKKILIAAGHRDPYSPRPGVEKLAWHLKEKGAEVDLRFTGESHGLETADLDAAESFFATALAP
jgi:phospholipase/carboxylesterase